MRRRPSLRSLVQNAHLPRILAVYISVSLGVLQTADVLQNRLGLPDWFFPGILGLLLAGLPLVVATALAQAARGRGPASGPADVLSPGDAGTASGDVAGTVPVAEPVPAGGTLADGSGRVRLLTWRNVALAGGTAFGLLAFSTAGYMGMRAAGIGPAGTLLGKGVLQPRDRVVVADVENHTPDGQLGAVVTEALRTQLEQSRSVTVIPAADIRATLARMQRDSTAALTEPLAREVAQRLGAKAVVSGEIGAAGSGYLLSAHVVAADTAAALVSVLEQADEPGRLIAAIDRLSGRLRERIGESLRSIRASPPLAQVTTSSLQALRLYSEATTLLSHSPGERERTLTMLQTAIVLDTGFASAYRAIGVALLNTGLERARGMAMLRRALVQRDRLPLPERFRTQALYDWNRGDYDRAAAAFRALLELNPADAGALNNLGGTYADRGDHVRADSFFRAALRLDPASSAAALNHAMALIALRQYDSARAYLHARSGPRPDLWTVYPTALLKSATEPPESLLAFARQARTQALDPEAILFATGAEAIALWTSGRLQEGDARSGGVSTAFRRQGLSAAAVELALGQARMRALVRGDVAGAARAADSALSESPLARIAAGDRPYLPLAYTLALSGRPGAARRALEEYQAALRAEEVVPEPAAEQLAKGAVALAERRFADALANFRLAHDLPGADLPMRECRSCATLMLARTFEAAGAADSAVAAYERFVEQPDPDRFWVMAALAPVHERLSDLYAARGDRNRTALHGAAFLRLWEGADPALQPRITAMRRRLELLSAER